MLPFHRHRGKRHSGSTVTQSPEYAVRIRSESSSLATACSTTPRYAAVPGGADEASNASTIATPCVLAIYDAVW